MSDQSEGPGWWEASDGKWYPPADPTAPVVPPPPTDLEPAAAPGRPWWKRSVPLWALIAAALVGLTVGAASGAASKSDDKVVAESSSSSSSEPTTTTASTSTSTTTTSTTTTLPPTTAATLPPEPVDVATFSGATDTQTDDFTVVGKWKMAFVVDGGGGGVIWKVVDSTSGATVQNGSVEHSQSQESQIRQGCTCYLDLTVIGVSYTITVTDLPD